MGVFYFINFLILSISSKRPEATPKGAKAPIIFLVIALPIPSLSEPTFVLGSTFFSLVSERER